MDAFSCLPGHCRCSHLGPRFPEVAPQVCISPAVMHPVCPNGHHMGGNAEDISLVTHYDMVGTVRLCFPPLWLLCRGRICCCCCLLLLFPFPPITVPCPCLLCHALCLWDSRVLTTPLALAPQAVSPMDVECSLLGHHPGTDPPPAIAPTHPGRKEGGSCFASLPSTSPCPGNGTTTQAGPSLVSPLCVPCSAAVAVFSFGIGGRMDTL